MFLSVAKHINYKYELLKGNLALPGTYEKIIPSNGN